MSFTIEFLAAGLITLGIIVGVPIYAWFAYSNSLETMTKIKEPENLDIRAGNTDAVINFDLREIDIASMKNDNKMACYVFSVSAGNYKIKYDLQLAHTTNIPFKYSLWKAERLYTSGTNGTSGSSGTSGTSGSSGTSGTSGSSGAIGSGSLEAYNIGSSILVDKGGSGSIVYYHPLANASEITSYRMVSEIGMTMLNPEYGLGIVPASGSGSSGSHYGRTIAQQSGTYYDYTYSGSDDVEIYAVPLYFRTTEHITPTEKGSNSYDYFILKLEWDEVLDDKTGFSKWNKAENNKETDIIYITASKSTD